uniref:SERPIN domain-containing protein n=1 Tax=Steinernema glaseri TaxID=37863 RepID=A0A1I7YQD0_9BILA
MVHGFALLDAPEKTVDLIAGELTFQAYEKLQSEDSEFWTSFSSVRLWSFNFSVVGQIVDDLLVTRRLQSITISQPVPESLNVFCVEFFFSESCSRLTAFFANSVVLRVINRWKTMDTRGLAVNKILDGIRASPTELAQAGMREVDLNSAKRNILIMVHRNVMELRDITSFHCIDHPVDPKSRIYVAFFGYNGCALFFE